MARNRISNIIRATYFLKREGCIKKMDSMLKDSMTYSIIDLGGGSWNFDRDLNRKGDRQG